MARQTRIPGTDSEKIKEVDDAAEGYVKARDKRMKLTEAETEAREALISVLKKHKLEVYRDDDATPPLLVTLTPGKDKVKVVTVDDDEGDDADEGSEE